uniref:C3H1-type domain-containing protein n=1 Tax=Glossina austeni TaxID=7395 RepID=A0A1A9VS69_GLOAU
MCSRLNCRFVHLTEDDKVEVCDQRVAVCRDHANGQCRPSSKIYNTAPPPPPAAAVAYHPVHYTTAGTPYHHPHHQLQQQHHHYHITPPYSPSAASTTSSNSSACPKPTSPILSSTTTLSTNSTATKPTPIAATHYVPTTTFLKASPAMTIAIATQAPLLLGNTNTNSEYGSNCIPIITTPPALTPLTPPTSPILSSTTTLSTNSTATKPTPIAATPYVPTPTFLKASPAMTIAIATQAPLLLGNTNTNSEYGSNCIPIITTPPALTPLTPVTQHPAFMYPATPQTQH